MSGVAWTLLLVLLLLPLVPGADEEENPTFQGTGEPCKQDSECHSNCCVTNSLNPQKFCTPQTIFQQCVPWRKPNGHSCLYHGECHSECCVRTGYSLERFCTSKTIFLQCVPWRKRDGDLCYVHKECWSQCCLRLREISPARCIPRSGILAQCLPM
uniref:Leucine-rich colipase-like protein 1 n=1 Tax=Castor canadensis TaxID=51338 RepID=A0A8C0XN06_CASCN